MNKNFTTIRNYTFVQANTKCSEFPYHKLASSLTCPLILGNNYLTDLPPRLAALNADKYIIITDHNVKKLYADRLLITLQQYSLNAHLLTFIAGEKSKNPQILIELAEQALNLKISKNSCLILVGGGVVGNIGGFLAGILFRGIRFVHVPTTSMAQLDSTTGGKQAVNTQHGKNLLGLYHEPEFIYINPSFVTTLSSREYYSGIAEAVKHGLCQSPKLLSAIARNHYEHILLQTIKLKIKLLKKDPREQNVGLILVYGHTIGHAIETCSDYKLTHGEAISIGMVIAARIAILLKIAKESLYDKHIDIFKKTNLPTRIPNFISEEAILTTLQYDKKRNNNQISFLLLKRVGSPAKKKKSFTFNVEQEIVKNALRLSY